MNLDVTCLADVNERELEPCPFCGSERITVCHGNRNKEMSIVCKGCNAKINGYRRKRVHVNDDVFSYHEENYDKLRELLIDKWNTRAKI